MALAGFDPAAAADRLEHNDGGSLFHKTYRHLYEGEKRANANRLAALVRKELDENGTEDGEEAREGLNHADSEDGRYWHRTWLQNGHLKYIGCAPGWAPVDHARTRPGQLGVNRPYPSSPIQLRAVGQALVRSPLRSPLVTPPVTKREPTDRQRFPKPCAAVRSGPGASDGKYLTRGRASMGTPPRSVIPQKEGRRDDRAENVRVRRAPQPPARHGLRNVWFRPQQRHSLSGVVSRAWCAGVTSCRDTACAVGRSFLSPGSRSTSCFPVLCPCSAPGRRSFISSGVGRCLLSSPRVPALPLCGSSIGSRFERRAGS